MAPLTPSRIKTTAIQTPRADGSNAVDILRQLKETTEVAQRLRGDPNDSFVTLGELVAAGIARNVSGTVQPPGLYVAYSPSSLATTSIVGGIQLSWSVPANVVAGVQYQIIEYTANSPYTSGTVVWRGTAQNATIHKTDLITRYYWVQTILPNGQFSEPYPAVGSAGISGVAGAKFLGAYDATTLYSPGDEVTSSGNYYLYINASPSTGNAPPNTTYWQLVGATSASDILYTGGATVQSLQPAEVSADVTSTHTAADTSNVNGVAAATVSQGAGRANAAIDSGNVVVAAGIDLSRAYTNKTLTNIPDGTSRFATPIFYLAPGSSGGWYKLGTVVFANYGDSAKIEYVGGPGFNTNSNQQYTGTITIRSGDGAAAPNLSGLSLIGTGDGAISAVTAVATGGSTSITNDSWDVYAEMSNYSNGHFTILLSPGSTWTWSGTAASNPGGASSTVVPGSGGTYLNPVNGPGMDAAFDGNQFVRMATPPAASAASVTSLTQTGPTINVAASAHYLGNLTINLSSGSVTPSTYGTYYVYADSVDWAGGTVTYQASPSGLAPSQGPFRFYLGSITTVSGGSGTGGGTNYCFSGDTRVLTAEGFRRFDELPGKFEIVNRAGRLRATLLVHPGSTEPMRRMGANLVTEAHRLRVGDVWVPAAALFHEAAPIQPRTVYNMEVHTDVWDDKHYILENGLTAHNPKP